MSSDDSLQRPVERLRSLDAVDVLDEARAVVLPALYLFALAFAVAGPGPRPSLSIHYFEFIPWVHVLLAAGVAWGVVRGIAIHRLYVGVVVVTTATNLSAIASADWYRIPLIPTVEFHLRMAPAALGYALVLSIPAVGAGYLVGRAIDR